MVRRVKMKGMCLQTNATIYRQCNIMFHRILAICFDENHEAHLVDILSVQTASIHKWARWSHLPYRYADRVCEKRSINLWPCHDCKLHKVLISYISGVKQVRYMYGNQLEQQLLGVNVLKKGLMYHNMEFSFSSDLLYELYPLNSSQDLLQYLVGSLNPFMTKTWFISIMVGIYTGVEHIFLTFSMANNHCHVARKC